MKNRICPSIGPDKGGLSGELNRGHFEQGFGWYLYLANSNSTFRYHAVDAVMSYCSFVFAPFVLFDFPGFFSVGFCAACMVAMRS